MHEFDELSSIPHPIHIDSNYVCNPSACSSPISRPLLRPTTLTKRHVIVIFSAAIRYVLQNHFVPQISYIESIHSQISTINILTSFTKTTSKYCKFEPQISSVCVFHFVLCMLRHIFFVKVFTLFLLCFAFSILCDCMKCLCKSSLFQSTKWLKVNLDHTLAHTKPRSYYKVCE